MFTPTASPSSKSASSHNNPATADDSCSSSESLGLLYSSPVDHPSRKRRLPSNSSLETKERSVDHLSSSCSSEKSAGEPVNRASRSSSAGTNVDSRSPTKRPRVSSGGSLVSWILPGMKSAMSWFSFSPKNTTKERLVECNGTSGKIPEYDDGSDPQTIVRNSTERHSKGKETVGDHGKTDEASSIVPHEQSESRVSSSLTSGSPKSKISNLNQGAGLLPKIQEYQVAPGSPVIFGSSLNDTLGSRGSAAYRRPSYQPARSRLSGIQYEPDLLAPRTTLRIRKPTFSILAKERSNRMMTAMSNLVMRSIPTYQDAAATGYKGTSSDYEGLVAYAEKVYRATAPKSPTKVSESTQETPQKLATPRQNTVGRYQSRLVGSFISRTQQEETVGEEPWIKQLREKIEAALRGHVDERGIVHQTAIATPTYDRLVKQDLEITGQLKKLSVVIEPVSSFPPLTDAIIFKLNKAFKGHPDEVLIDKFNVSLKRADLLTLRDGQWLNDEVINFYGQLMMERATNAQCGSAKHNSESYPNIHFFNTFFYSTLRDQGYDRVKRWTRKFDIFAKDYVILPVHLGVHWCCAVINFKRKRLEYYDSMHGNNSQCFQLLRLYLNKESMDKKKTEFNFEGWVDFAPKNIPAQTNGYDCGVFTCMFAEYSSREAPFDFTQAQMVYLRKRIAYEIISGRLAMKANGPDLDGTGNGRTEKNKGLTNGLDDSTIPATPTPQRIGLGLAQPPPGLSAHRQQLPPPPASLSNGLYRKQNPVPMKALEDDDFVVEILYSDDEAGQEEEDVRDEEEYDGSEGEEGDAEEEYDEDAEQTGEEGHDEDDDDDVIILD